MPRSRNAGRREQLPARGGPDRAAVAGLLLAVVLFFLPGAVVGRMPAEDTAPEPTLPIDRAPAVPTRGARDRGRVVRLARQDGSVEELTMEDYLWGVVAAEMPASFEPEALKAQAAAARTYTVTLQNAAEPKHGDAQVCDDSACCQAYVDRSTAEARWGLQAGEFGDKITRAVSETDGLGVLYRGQPIQAVFFSSAAGRTVDAVEVWGSSVDYLKGVDSPEGDEVPNYRSQAVLTADQVRAAVLDACPGADLSGDPEGWITGLAANSAGNVSQVTVGGVELTGAQARTILGLRSASFTVSYADGAFTFDVTGYGHGVGMSQYGANAMAKDGADFQEILTWYYTGTEVGPLWE